MCGISGIVGHSFNESSLLNMIKVMEKRGPDSNGIWLNTDKTIGLGHTRLSILDLSNRGHQPMISSSNKFYIVFNGEIYNFKEIRNQLETLGVVFRTNSDTEVILNAWEIWGIVTIEKLRGMFSFAIWDIFSEKLFLVRDRLGLKPLLFSKTDKHLIFGSTLSAVLASNMVQPILNNNAFFQYLGNGTVLQPDTMIRGIESLMPGHYLTFHKGSVTINQYWKLERKIDLVNNLEKLSSDELIKKTRLHLEESCNYHLIADVPIGSFLSGGVDSTSITALMAQRSSIQVKTFSVGFESGLDYKSELTEAKIAADYLKTDHNELVVTENDLIDNFEDFISVLDQPSIDGLNTYLVSKVASKNVKVAFSGLGADEIFAGYDHFSWPNTYNNYKPSYLDKFSSKLYSIKPNRISYFSYLSCLTPNQRLSVLRQQFSNDSICKIVSDNLVCKFNINYMEKYINSLNLGEIKSANEISLYEVQNYLLNTLIRDSDSAGMGNSLEIRPPFLDHKLVEFALALPHTMKWNNGIGKFALKEATKDLLPKDFYSRKKQGFSLPISRWIFGNLGNEVRDILNDDYSFQFINQNGAKKLLHDLNLKRNGWQLYQMLVFLKWAKKHNVYVD